MKLIKYEHACFTVEIDGRILLVDPGNMTDDLGTLETVVGIVVTHEHSDHFDPERIQAIAAHNPQMTVFGPREVVSQLGTGIQSIAVLPGQTIECLPFRLEFSGGEHQKAFEDSPIVASVAVLINDLVYHASDSFVLPNRPVNTLILPISGSWMSARMARDFLFEIKPKIVIPSHDAILSEKGKRQVDKYWPVHAEQVGAKYIRTSEPIEIDE